MPFLCKRQIHHGVQYAAMEPSACHEFKGNEAHPKKDHQHMFHIQTQIFVNKADYADFVLWTENDVHVERSSPNVEMWYDTVPKCKDISEGDSS